MAKLDLTYSILQEIFWIFRGLLHQWKQLLHWWMRNKTDWQMIVLVGVVAMQQDWLSVIIPFAINTLSTLNQ